MQKICFHTACYTGRNVLTLQHTSLILKSYRKKQPLRIASLLAGHTNEKGMPLQILPTYTEKKVCLPPYLGFGSY